MLKKILAVILLVGIGSSVYALSETWFSLGFEYGNFFENLSDSGNTAKSYLGSPGVNLNMYQFWNGMDIGIFVHDLFAFPKNSTTEINGVKYEADLSVYDFRMQVGIITGPGFRYNFNDRLKLQFGIGFSFLETVASYSMYTEYGTLSYFMLAFNFGVGSDVGIKYDITNIFYLNIGSIVGIDFANHTSISSSMGSVSDWASRYSMLHVRPYICIGFNWYRESDNLGKPKT
jgi:hypothetical protein